MRALSGLTLSLVVALSVTGCGDETASSTVTAGSSASIRSNATPGTSPAPSSAATPSQAATPSTMPEESLTPAAPPSEPVSTEVVDATPETVAGYRALANGLTAMFEKAGQIEKESPDVNPQGADEIKEVLGDVFPDGVDLVKFEEEGDAATICLTGPETTFVVLGQRGEGLRQIYGGGNCDDASSIRDVDDADVVVDLDFEVTSEGKPRVRFVSRVVRGQNLVDEVPELLDYIDVLNRAAAG